MTIIVLDGTWGNVLSFVFFFSFSFLELVACLLADWFVAAALCEKHFQLRSMCSIVSARKVHVHKKTEPARPNLHHRGNFTLDEGMQQ
jgi:hypothetical protein